MAESKYYYAHSGDAANRQDWHRLRDHLKGTGIRADKFLEPAGHGDWGRAAGLLHDLGKYTREFQNRLVGGPRCDHATAGAKEALDRYGGQLGKLVAYCVAGHHAGLADGENGEQISALADRLRKDIPALDPAWKDEVFLPELTALRVRPRNRETAGFSAALFVRMLFSALVDADFLDTEAYYAKIQKKPELRGRHPALSDLLGRLDSHLNTLTSSARPGAVNDLRQEVLSHARGKAKTRPGLFSLTVPTGGGKTLTSLAFALAHAVQHGLARVIYVIPYMSIIEQTAAVFRNALQSGDAGEADFVVEHHSSFDEERIGQREAREKLQLATENWDAPIVVTTAVQFFESLFSNRPSQCRKLHNIAASVVILDEAQTLPLEFLRPCVTTLDELARNWRASVVLCTATQPALREEDGFLGGLQGVEELAPNPQGYYQALKHTRIRDRGEMDDTSLAACLRASPQVLCIVNTRRHARELFEAIEDAEGAFHLTTLMCARHRRERFVEVRERLRSGAPVRLVATSLIEAGVDVDFPTVWRAEAGLESIVQAAGRCNREGRKGLGDVFVFRSAGGKLPPGLGQLADAARNVMRHYEDPASLEAIEAYFKELYWIKGNDALDTKRILSRTCALARDLNFPFEGIAKDFRLIETWTRPVIVPYRGADGKDDTAERLLNALEWVERPGGIARRLQPFTVQIPPYALSALLAAGAVETLAPDKFERQFDVLTNMALYDASVGLSWDDPTFRRVEDLIH